MSKQKAKPVEVVVPVKKAKSNIVHDHDKSLLSMAMKYGFARQERQAILSKLSKK